MRKNTINYEYIKLLPQNKIVYALKESLLNDKYINGIFNDDIYGYNRDDNSVSNIPSLSVYHGKLFSYDNYNRLEGELRLNVYYPIKYNRDDTTETLETCLAVLQNRIQNNTFINNVLLNMFDYNKMINSFRNEFDKNCFVQALQKKCPLQRFAINMRIDPGNIIKPKEINECYKAEIKFDYWMSQQAYYDVLEIIGIDGKSDPNKIIYNKWQEFEITVDNI